MIKRRSRAKCALRLLSGRARWAEMGTRCVPRPNGASAPPRGDPLKAEGGTSEPTDSPD